MGQWACRELAARLADEERSTSDQRQRFIARNRRELVNDVAAELHQLASGPQRYELPWAERERVRLALSEALRAVEASEPPRAASASPSAAPQRAARPAPSRTSSRP